MTTTATSKSPPTAKSGGAVQPDTSFAELVHYSPEQVEANFWLPMTARTLRDKASAREIPHSKAGGRISFTLRHIREIAAMYEVRPLSEKKRAA